jgi:hypothetical protein
LLHYLLDRSLVRVVIVGGLGLSCGRRQRLGGERYGQKRKHTEYEVIQFRHDFVLNSNEMKGFQSAAPAARH